MHAYDAIESASNTIRACPRRVLAAARSGPVKVARTLTQARRVEG